MCAYGCILTVPVVVYYVLITFCLFVFHVAPDGTYPNGLRDVFRQLVIYVIIKLARNKIHRQQGIAYSKIFCKYANERILILH